MPELPEVETIRRELAPEIEGRVFERVWVHAGDILLDDVKPSAFRARVEGRRVREVARRAKYLLFRLEDDVVLQTQLRMTGRFIVGRERPEPEEFGHIAAEFRLDDGRTLFYDDVRRLGGFRLWSVAEWTRAGEALGPEPLGRGFHARRLAAVLRGRSAPVKNVLMDQRRLAGVGNIYASEALHRARIDPRRRGGSLDEAEIRRLHRAVRGVLREALAASGTTVRDYRGASGSEGRFQERLRVYGREGEPCPRCGGPVGRVVQAGRSTFFCDRCQG